MTAPHRLLLLAALVAGAPAAAVAHDTWLLPMPLTAAPGAGLELELTSGMAFPAPETAIAPERVARSGVRLAGRSRDLELAQGAAAPASAPAAPPAPAPAAGATAPAPPAALRFTTRVEAAGVATLWVALHPRKLEIESADDVEHYLEEIGAPASIRARWEATPGRRWRESYAKHTKAFVRVGEPSGDRSWAEPVGLGLELVPEQDPTALRAGDALTVRLLQGGKPLADTAVGAVRGGASEGTLARTDGEGRVTFRLAEAGPWMLRSTVLRPAAGADLDWESDFITLVFAVR